jgi:hypothetical protein
MTLNLTQIYNLLPAVYRIRDAQIALSSPNALDPADFARLQQLLSIHGPLTYLQQLQLNELQDKQQRGPLKSLIAILAEQIEVLQESLYQSYDDLFIETCADWVVPYIADLVGLKGLVDVPSAGYTVRAAVTDTIKNRRRKGTVAVLEAIARDVTQWDANVVEFFQVLAITQFMNHIRPGNLSMADIRNADDRLLNTPFDTYARTAEMRNIETGLGKYNIPNIGIFLWRLGQQQMENSPAYPVDARRFCFDPLGRDIPLFTLPVTETAATPRATPLNVAMPISRRMLFDDLKGPRNYYGPGLSIFVDYGQGPPPAGFPVCACNLSDVKDSGGNVIGWAHKPQDCIGIDPQLGRIAFPQNQPPPASVHVTYCYGFSSEIGGGPYNRPFDTPADVEVPRDAATIQAGLNLAVGMLSASKTSVVVEVTNNEYYIETPTVNIPAKASVQLRARNGNRPVLRLLNNDLTVIGGDESVFNLNGFMVFGGSITAKQAGSTGDAITLNISHCTLNPGKSAALHAEPEQPPVPAIWIDAANITVNIDHSILGALRSGTENTVSLTICIVDALSPSDVAYACHHDAMAAAAPLTVTNSTIIGKVHTERMELASNTIFLAEPGPLDQWTAPVLADQLQQGCVRFSYVPPGSRVPRCFHCYPVANKVSTPAFTSLRFGDPGYCQLTDRSGLILTGADDQSEVGVFHDIFQPQRLSNLRIMVADYLRFGLEAGIFFAT